MLSREAKFLVETILWVVGKRGVRRVWAGSWVVVLVVLGEKRLAVHQFCVLSYQHSCCCTSLVVTCISSSVSYSDSLLHTSSLTEIHRRMLTVGQLHDKTSKLTELSLCLFFSHKQQRIKSRIMRYKYVYTICQILQINYEIYQWLN